MQTTPGPIRSGAGVEGGHDDDQLYGENGADAWDCGGQACGLRGLDGADYAEGNANFDILSGGANSDVLLGGTGDDDIYASDNSQDVVDGGDGFDNCWVDLSDTVTSCNTH